MTTPSKCPERCPRCDADCVPDGFGDMHSKGYACGTIVWIDNQTEQSERCQINVLTRERDALCAGLTCFSCGVTYSQETREQKCEMAHREEWGHEWVSRRVNELTGKVVMLTRDLAAAREQNEKLAMEAELLDLINDFHLGVKRWRGGRWTVDTLVMPVLAWARDAGPWDSPREALTACRAWVLSPEGPGWANRKK